ncbi:MAG: hypothetical protein U0270_18695 [Labilithrix sp.]
MFLRRAALVVLPILAACSANASETDDATGVAEGAYGDRVGQDTLTTTEPGITLFDGYNSLFDLRRAGCTVADKSAPPPSVGQPAQQTTIRVVKSDTELAKELGVDASFAVKAPIVSANASASLLRSFKGATSSVNYLIQAVQSYVVVSNAPFALTDDAKKLLATKPQDFLVRCGDRFVNAVTYQAKIEALVTFETSSEDAALKLEGSIAAGGSVSVAELSGSIKSRLSDASKKEDIKTSVTVTAQGFDLTGNETLISLDGTLDEKLTKIDAAAGALRTSLQQDRENDAKDFFKHLTRRAIPAVVHVTRYGMATNAPSGVDSSLAFKSNQNMMRDTETYLRAFGQLKLKMEHAWKYEIQDFQEAGADSQAYYNLMPPAAPRRSTEEVAQVASAWASRFRSDDGIKIGTDLNRIQNAISTCAESAKSGDFTDCLPGTDPTTLPEYKAGLNAIDEYLKTGRVVRMRAFVVENGKEMTYAAAQEACKNVNGVVDRLPSSDEARRLAPLVSGYGGTQKSTWIADTATCKYSQSGLAFYANPNDNRDRDVVGCDGWSIFSGGSRAVICVQQTGPVGKRDDL